MAVRVERLAAAGEGAGQGLRARLQLLLPKLVLAPSFAALLLFVYGFILLTIYCRSPIQDPAELRLVGLATTSAVPAAELVGGAAEPGDLRRPVHRACARPWACCWRSCSIRRSAARACCARSTSIRWRSPSSSPAPRGSGSSIPASASRRWCAAGAGRASPSTGSRPRQGDLLRRHRRGVAVDRLRHGDVPRRPARHRQRDHPGRADRRRLGAAIYRRIIIPSCGRCSSRPSWCSPIWRSSATTW